MVTFGYGRDKSECGKPRSKYWQKLSPEAAKAKTPGWRQEKGFKGGGPQVEGKPIHTGCLLPRLGRQPGASLETQRDMENLYWLLRPQ